MDYSKLTKPLVTKDMGSEEYHNTPGTWSSSQLKTMNEDPEVFHRKYIAKTEERQESAAFDVGTYFHTSLLEPEKVATECAVFEGIRRGKEWEKFQEENKGKAIITATEHKVALGLVDAVRKSPISMARLAQGDSEVSAFVPIYVYGTDIYSHDGRVLGKYGWTSEKGKVPKGAVHLVIKVRADRLAESYILDLKSTTGNAKNEYAMRGSISKYTYDLSAALYLDMFTIGLDRDVSEFVWTFASKDMFNCKSYIASNDNILIGRAKYKKAIADLAFYISNDWEFEDSIGILNPNPWELEHIREKGESIL
jgi:hypothetical protein